MIQVWLEHDLSLSAIALKLGRATSIITREFSRHTQPQPAVCAAPTPTRARIAGGYRCANAQYRAQRLARKPRVARKMVADNALCQRVLGCLRGGLSPE